jgi:hypothetical protein
VPGKKGVWVLLGNISHFSFSYLLLACLLFVLSCLDLACFVFSRLALSYLVLTLYLACLALPCREKELAAVKVDKEDIKVITEELEVSSNQRGLKWKDLVVSCRVMPCRFVSCVILSCRVLSCRVVSCLVVPCLAMYCRVLPCLVFSCQIRFKNFSATIFCSQNKGFCGSCRQSAQGGWRGFRARLENTGSLKIRALV